VNQDELKRRVAEAALQYAQEGVIGVGSGSTVNAFIDCLSTVKHKIVGAGIVGVHAGELIAELALAIEMGAEAADIGHTIHPHPTLSESVGMAAEAFEGTITDLYLPKTG
jgi:dihydrolipoamide dehydrogenase